ncbi:hypothetical protein [Wenjunlia tyrosinilytica]|uniref:Uncharacterized protein n=1 Tax=Wenjunlia tyrosinilytica TaxID=1544741 RepID=A0A917ZWY9_9ACTN|nr:hypothetical protein [Wenjunlia tyrosinilytica]GGO96205.1 hypothetical protein GCM10012280_55170 [Wenjunlia tyrosinilytica]
MVRQFLARTGRRPRLPEIPWPSLMAGSLVTAYVAVFVWGMEHTSYDTWGALLILPLLMAVSAPFIGRIAARDPDPRTYRLLMLALAFKLVAAFPRFLMAFVLYDGQSDAAMYDDKGRVLAALFRHGVFQADIGRPVEGTGFVIILTGIAYTLVGPSISGGFLFFSWLGFWGLVMFWRAVQIGFPAADSRRYALFVFFLPSLLFWPSSIGKDSWMMLTLGVMAYGAARVLRRMHGGFAVLALGSVGTAMVRPHITLLAGAGLGVAYLLRRRPDKVSALGPIKAVAGIAVMGVGIMLMLQQASAFFGLDGTDSQGVSQVLSETQRRTSQGGSAAVDASGEAAGSGPPVNLSPVNLPMNVVTVLFRPFPFEAHNVQALVASVECFALMIVFIMSWARLRRLPKLFLKEPYIAFTAVYSLLFCWAFSNINNLGILTRERVQVLPLVLVLLAIPRRAPEAGTARGAARSQPLAGPHPPGPAGPGGPRAPAGPHSAFRSPPPPRPRRPHRPREVSR